jgi:hypothetical protein
VITNRTHWLLKGQFLWSALVLAAVLGFRASLLAWRLAIMTVAVAVGGTAANTAYYPLPFPCRP